MKILLLIAAALTFLGAWKAYFAGNTEAAMYAGVLAVFIFCDFLEEVKL